MVLKIKRRLFFTIHSWIGITAGLMLFVICWSGTVAVFSYELDWLLNPGIRANTVATALDWQRAYDVFTVNYPESRLLDLSAPRKPGYAIDGIAVDSNSVPFHFYVDPLTYELIEKTSFLNVQRFFRSFHMVLFQEGMMKIFGVPFGFWVVTLMGLVLLASSITGFIFYKKWNKGFFKLELHKGVRRLWSDLHKLVGLWSILFALIVGLTGVWYLMEWWLSRPPRVNTSELQESKEPLVPKINELYETAQKAYPELRIQRLTFSDLKKGLISFEGNDGSLLVRKRAAYVLLNVRTREVFQIQKPGSISTYHRWWETVDHVHFGKFGGVWSKVLWFLFGVALSTLCLSGAYLQARRQRLKNGVKRHRLSVVFSYLATIGILVSATLAGIHEIKEYGINGSWPDIPRSVAVFISLWVVSTLTALTVWMRVVR